MQTQDTGGLGRFRVPLVVVVLLVGAILRAGAAYHHRAVDYDEGRYLDNAVNIMKGRGLASHYTSHFFRPDAAPLHPEEISSPLFPYLLAATFAVTGADLASAQLWSLVPGCLMILLTFILGRRLLDERTGLLASLLVALNPDMVILSSWAMTESLYTAMLLGILLMVDRQIASKSTGPAMLWSVWVGSACGALYLLRANGLAVAGAAGLVVLLRTGPRAAAVFGGCFLAVISPWLIRNAVLFGSPTYTAMKHVAWTESGRDLFTRSEEPPSLQRFHREQGGLALMKNIAHRGWRAARYLAWGDTGAFNLLCALFPVALLVTLRQPRLMAGHLCTLLTAALLIGVPVWTGALSRYLTPVRPWIYLIAIGAAFQIVPALVWRRRIQRSAKGEREVAFSTEPARRMTAAAAATLVALVGVVSASPLRELVSRDQRAKDFVAREAARWIAQGTPEGSVLLEGAYIHQYAFLYDRSVVWVPSGGLDEVRRTAADYGARYLVVTEELLRFRPELKRHFSAGPEGIRGPDLPEGFVELFAGTGRKVVIFQVPEGSA